MGLTLSVLIVFVNLAMNYKTIIMDITNEKCYSLLYKLMYNEIQSEFYDDQQEISLLTLEFNLTANQLFICDLFINRDYIYFDGDYMTPPSSDLISVSVDACDLQVFDDSGNEIIYKPDHIQVFETIIENIIISLCD